MEYCYYDISYIPVEECDYYARSQGGVVRSFYEGTQIPIIPDDGKVNDEYRIFITKTFGLGNEGLIILSGLNPRTRGLIRTGKIRQLEYAGVRKSTAEIAVDCKHGNEKNVSVLADMLVELCKKFKFSGESFKDFYKFAPFAREFVQENKLSFPRILSAIAIAEKVK